MTIYNSDIYFFYQKSVFVISEKKFIELKPNKWDDQFKVIQIKMNRLGTCLSLIGKKKVLNLIIDKSSLNLHKKGTLEFPLIQVGSSEYDILHVEYHPMSDIHLLVLSGDYLLKVFNLTLNNIEPEQIIKLKGRPISFCFGAKSEWSCFSIFYLTLDGFVYLLSPIIPHNMKISKSLLKDLDNGTDEIKKILKTITGEELKNDFIRVKKHNVPTKIFELFQNKKESKEVLCVDPVEICYIYGGKEYSFLGIVEKSKKCITYGFLHHINPFIPNLQYHLTRLYDFDVDLEDSEKISEDTFLYSNLFQREVLYSFSKYGLIEMKLPIISEIENNESILSNCRSKILSENEVIGISIKGDYVLFVDKKLNLNYHQISTIEKEERKEIVMNMSFQERFDLEKEIKKCEQFIKDFPKIQTTNKTKHKHQFDSLNSLHMKKLELCELMDEHLDQKFKLLNDKIKEIKRKKEYVEKIKMIEQYQNKYEEKYNQIIENQKRIQERKEKILKNLLQQSPSKNEIESYFILREMKTDIHDMEYQLKTYQNIKKEPLQVKIDFSLNSFKPVLDKTTRNIHQSKEILNEIKKTNLFD